MTIKNLNCKISDLDQDNNLIDVPVKYFTNESGDICVTSETGQCVLDYYSDMWINPRLEEWAEKNGCFWEWENAGCIVLVQD